MSHSLAAALKYYFQDYLARCQGVSRNTLAAYQQAMELFVVWLKKRLRKDSARRIRLASIRPEHILDFLAYLEEPRRGRSNCPASRNARLAAIKGFFRAVALWNAQYAPLAKRIKLIPAKRLQRRDPDYLNLDELKEIFRQIDTATPLGVRDAALFLFMLNCGARASEVAGAKLSWIVLQGPFRHARIVGKGNRERVCPLWDETAAMIAHYALCFRQPARCGDPDTLFVNCRRCSLTRSGVLKLVKRYTDRAAQQLPSLKRKRVYPHTMRHSTGVLLLRAGVDISVIRSWLGHVRLDTTCLYARLTALDKRDALEKFLSLGKVFSAQPDSTAWQADRALIEWLDSL